jgi:isocitrate lyase
MGSTATRPAQTAQEISDMRPQDNLEHQWKTDPRWEGVKRPYSARDVSKLRGSIQVEHTLARLGAERLWWLLHNESYVPALGALTGNQAVQQVQAGLKAIYLSGWQVAADANDAGQMYPDQSLYPADSVPNVARHINNALMRADQVHHLDGKNSIYWMAPIVADAEAGFGGTLPYLLRLCPRPFQSRLEFRNLSRSANSR